jgi:hypothetical protein
LVPADAHEVLARDDLYRRIRDEIYAAKVLVRSSRNHTKNTAAALQDREDALDALLDELDALPPDPHARRRPRDNGKAEQHPTLAEERLEGAIR